jgi:hypothetical protein
MKADRVFWGLILILFGILFMLQNMGYITFQFSSIWKWWPLLLVYWGFSALLKGNSGKTSPILYGIQIIILAILIYVVVRPKTAPLNERSFRYEYKGEDQKMEGERTYQFEIPMEDAINSASLDLSFGAGELTLKAGKKGRLIGADATTNFGNYSFENSIKDGKATIALGYASKRLEYNEGSFSNVLEIDLNPIVLWDIMLETGASKADLDLSDVRVKSLALEGGASRLILKLGQPDDLMRVSIETGASSISILIPEGARCELITEDGLSSKSIKGLDKIENGKYRSPNYDEVSDAGTINILLESGLSKIDVKTY